MFKRPKPLILILLTLCACQGGRIPCPEIETVKLHRSFRTSPATLSAKIDSEAEVERAKESRPATVRYIQNVSVEEWDCPRPGKKRYLPKSVKANIKNNRKRIESDMKKNYQQTDSLSSR